jgi:hypothetical protein
MHVFSIYNDTKILLKNFTSKNKNKFLVNFYSSIVAKFEHSFEAFYELLKPDQTFYKKKENIIFVFETLKLLLKLKELKSLNNEGFNFYVEKSIYFSKVLEISEEQELEEIEKKQ